MDLLGGKGHQGSPLDEKGPDPASHAHGEPSTLPRPWVGLSRGRPRRMFCGGWHGQLATCQGQFCRKRGLQAVSPSTERGCLMCAHIPTFYQLSKSDGQKRD